MGRLAVLLAIVLWAGGSVHAQVPPIFAPGTEVHDIYCRACAHFFPEVLPVDSEFRLDRAICGTSAIRGLTANWDRLPPAAKEAFAFLQQRPILSHSVLSSEGRFKIHYNTTGTHAVAPTDADANGVPDYVDEAARVFEAVWDLEINQLGYNPPPSDGDGVYDVYIKNLALRSVYGYAHPIAYTESRTPSYIEIDNNFTDSIYPVNSRGFNGLRVTAAHEFFHAIQFGYYADNDAAWWQELTATWMEDVAYPDVNDFYHYMSCSSYRSCFYDDPEASLDKFSNSLHPFGASIFAHHMEQVYGADVIKSVWELLRRRDPSNYSLSLIDDGMPLGGFAQVMPRFAAWNYLTDVRTRPGYYVEARDLPSIKHANIVLDTGGSVEGTKTVDHLGTTYLRVPTSNITGGLRGAFALDNQGAWILQVMLISPSGVELLYPNGRTVMIPRANRFDEVVFIVMETSLSGERRRVDYTLSTGGSTATDLVCDVDGDGRVAFSDFHLFADGFKRLHTDDNYDPKLDFNGDGPVDFRDFLIFVSHFGESR